MSCLSAEWPHYHHHNLATDPNFELSTNKSSIMSSINDFRNSKIRKSRTSKRSPVTILNADVSNFRALVQQLTGRPSAPTRLRAQRGPLNINFRQPKEVHSADHVNTKPELLPFVYNKYQQQQQTKHRKDEKEQVVLEHEQASSAQSKGIIEEFCGHTRMNYFDEFDEVGVEQCLQELEWVPSTNVDEH